MPRKPLLIPALLCLSATFAPAQADPTLLSFTERAQKSVTPDTVDVQLRYEARGRDPASVQLQLNENIGRLSKELHKQGIAHATGAYSVYPEYQQDRRTGWIGSQQITLTGRESAPLLEIAGQWQEKGFILGGVNFGISPALRQSVRLELIGEAVKAINETAGTTARALGMQVKGIARLSLDAPLAPQHVMAPAAGALRAPAFATPVAEPGTLDVDVSLQAEVLME
ncbi:MAG: SIMPL domain-containing protein [Pseudomonadota bacterium]